MTDNAIPFTMLDSTIDVDDDALIADANTKIAQWQSTGTPSLTEVQELFHEVICNNASAMARDHIVEAILAAFGTELGGKRAMISTWGKIEKDFAAECAQDARASTTDPELTPAQKAALRETLWPSVRELAQAPNLIRRVVEQVQAMGVVNERDLIVLTYIAATSRILKSPINVLTKGASSGGKSFTTTHVLAMIGSDYVNQLTSSSALSLVYDTRPLSHTVVFLFEAAQMQAEKQSERDSTFAMLVRTLISEGRIIHQTTVEDQNSPTGRRVERIVREGPISFIVTTTGTVYDENETRMLSWHVHEDRDQTQAVMQGLATHASGFVAAPIDLAVWHDLQHWLALGPSDAIIPFAPQIAEKIPPLMVRYRRDVGALFNFIKASAILHQAQRQIDDHGRVVATIADYALAFPIFSKVMGESSGKTVPDNVRAVVELIAERTKTAATKPAGMRFTRVESVRDIEVTISCEQIGTATGLGKATAWRAVRTAIDLGFLINNEIRPKKPLRLVLKRQIDAPAISLLPDPTTITVMPSTEEVTTNGT
jgi:hypothetical protein